MATLKDMRYVVVVVLWGKSIKMRKFYFWKKGVKHKSAPCEISHKKVPSGFLNDGRGLII